MSDPQQPRADAPGANEPDPDVAIEEPGAASPEAAPPPTTPVRPRPGRAPCRTRRRAAAVEVAHDVPADHHRQRDHLGAGRGARPHRGRDHDRVHRRTRARDQRVLLRAAGRHALGDLAVGVGCLLRALPGVGLQLPARHVRRRHPPAHRDAHVRDPAHRRWPRRRPRVPRRHVQHRWPRPDAHRGIRRRMDRLRVRPAVGRAHDRRPRRRPRRRRALGRHRRPPQGPHRRARGDRDDHAQLRRVLPRVVAAANAGPAAGARFEQPEDARDEAERGLPRPARAAVQPALRVRPRDPRHGHRLVDPQPVEPRVPVPCRRRSTRTPPASRASTSRACTSTRCSSRVRCSASPASARCSAPSPPASPPASTRASASTRSRSPCSVGRRPWGTFVAGHPVRRVQGRRLLDAGGRGRAHRDRARRAVAHRAVHRRAAARAHDLPSARPERQAADDHARPSPRR